MEWTGLATTRATRSINLYRQIRGILRSSGYWKDIASEQSYERNRVCGVALQVARGTISLGSGKWTAGKLLTGRLAPTAGEGAGDRPRSVGQRSRAFRDDA